MTTERLLDLKVTVCIASIGRQSVLTTLESLADCHLPEDTIVDVVIADDSASGSVELMLSNHPASWPFGIKIIPSAAANISIARNTCLCNASGDYLAFIDDDETADREWLASFIKLAKSTGADAIFGPVNAIYPPGAIKWICDAQPFVKITGQNGEKVSTGSTCNAFVKRSSIVDFKLSFQPELGKSGGEDTAFFAQLNQRGGMLIASEQALVYENVPIERLNIHYLRRRYLRSGQTYAMFFISTQAIVSRIFSYALTSVKIAVLLPIIILTALINRRLALKFAFKLWLNLGKIRCLFNMPVITLY